MIICLKYYELNIRWCFCVLELCFNCSLKAQKGTELTSTYYGLRGFQSDKHEQKQFNIVLYVCFYAK